MAILRGEYSKRNQRKPTNPLPAILVLCVMLAAFLEGHAYSNMSICPAAWNQQQTEN